jgi:putative component of toxin-antitoxin plasmid stabilization module
MKDSYDNVDIGYCSIEEDAIKLGIREMRFDDWNGYQFVYFKTQEDLNLYRLAGTFKEDKFMFFDYLRSEKC